MGNLRRAKTASAGRFHQYIIGDFYLFGNKRVAEPAKFIGVIMGTEEGKNKRQFCLLMPEPSQIDMFPSAVVVSERFIPD